MIFKNLWRVNSFWLSGWFSDWSIPSDRFTRPLIETAFLSFERISFAYCSKGLIDHVFLLRYVARGNAGDRADYVPARALDWDVPKVERLWFGDDAEDKKIRLKVKEMTIL